MKNFALSILACLAFCSTAQAATCSYTYDDEVEFIDEGPIDGDLTVDGKAYRCVEATPGEEAVVCKAKRAALKLPNLYLVGFGLYGRFAAYFTKDDDLFDYVVLQSLAPDAKPICKGEGNFK